MFRDLIIVEATPPAGEKEKRAVTYKFDTRKDEAPKSATILKNTAGLPTFEVPVEQPTPPGIKARLRLATSIGNP